SNHTPMLAEDEPVLLPDEDQPKPARNRLKPVVEKEQPLAVQEDEEEEPVKEKPKKHFSWMAVLLIVLGILSLGAISAAPFLPGQELETTGNMGKFIPKPQRIEESASGIGGSEFIMAAPGGVALFAFLSLLIGLITRRFGFLNLFLIYLAVLG